MLHARKSTNKGMHYARTFAQHSAQCSVCQSEFRDAIDRMLLRGRAYTTIAKDFPGITASAIRRHHISTGMRDIQVEQCEKYWGDIVRASWPATKKKVSLEHGLKASEFIAKKAGAFKEKHEHEHRGEITIDEIARAESRTAGNGKKKRTRKASR